MDSVSSRRYIWKPIDYFRNSFIRHIKAIIKKLYKSLFRKTNPSRAQKGEVNALLSRKAQAVITLCPLKPLERVWNSLVSGFLLWWSLMWKHDFVVPYGD